MGVKVIPEANPIPAWFEDSKLKYAIGDVIFETPVNAIKTLKFKKQCNMFDCEKIYAYLYNDEYIMLLRVNGTGNIYTREGHYIVQSFMYQPIERKSDYKYISGGAIKLDEFAKQHHMVALYYNSDDGTNIFSAKGAPLSIAFCDNDINRIYKADIKTIIAEGYPELILKEDGVYSHGPNNENVYKIDGDLSVSKGFTSF